MLLLSPVKAPLPHLLMNTQTRKADKFSQSMNNELKSQWGAMGLPESPHAPQRQLSNGKNKLTSPNNSLHATTLPALRMSENVMAKRRNILCRRQELINMKEQERHGQFLQIVRGIARLQPMVNWQSIWMFIPGCADSSSVLSKITVLITTCRPYSHWW
jgi:hypothetical protein